MALVTSLEPGDPKARQSVHATTQCLYYMVKGPSNEPYLQLDTFGSRDRVSAGKISQSIQFDRQAARQLLQLLRRAFPDLANEPNQDSSSEATATEDEDEEGRILFLEHRRRERKPRLVRKKKRIALRDAGRLLCEVCDFDFAAVYGILGNGFAECHHRTPLADLDGAAPTRLADLAIVCANCHRMLHRRPVHTIEQLRAVVRTRLAADAT